MSSTDGKSHTSDETHETPDVVEPESTNVSSSAPNDEPVAPATDEPTTADAPETETTTADVSIDAPTAAPSPSVPSAVVADAATDSEPAAEPVAAPAPVDEPAPVDRPTATPATDDVSSPAEPASAAAEPASAAAEPAPAVLPAAAPDPAPVAAPAPAVELPIILRTKPAPGSGSAEAGASDSTATLASTMLPPRAEQSAPTGAAAEAPAGTAAAGATDAAASLSEPSSVEHEDVARPAVEAPVVSSLAAAAVEPAPEPAPEPAVETRPAAAAEPRPESTPGPSDPTPESEKVEVVSSPLGVFDGSSTPSRLPKVLLWTGLGLLIAAGAYLGAQWYFADRIPRGTTVAGVDIGGLAAEEATARLTAELGGVATQPVPVTAGDGAGSIDPGTAGLTFDAEATVAGLTEFTLDPRPLLAQIAGGDAVDPVTVVDDELFGAATEALVVDLETPATSGTVAFVDGAAVQTPAVEGTSVDQEGLRETIVDSWLTAARPLDLETVPLEPEITQAETDAAFTEAQRVAAAPVSVSVSGQVAELPVDALTAAATYAPVDGALVLTFDGPTLVEGVLARTSDLLSNAADASFVFVDGAPQIQPGTPGTTLDPAGLAAAVQQAALGDERTAAVELTASDPAQSTAALEALGVTQIVSEFSTPLTNEPDRTENLRIAAGKVTGVLVRPGETFSLLDTLGPITTANGYLQAHVIVDGEITNGTGGGLSQMSTTTYNAGFFAGMVDVSHTPHSYWFSRYPEGREATLYEGQIDMEWRNDSPYGVLLQSWVAGGRVHVAAWSTPYYTVETTTSSRSNVVSPTTQHKSGPSCAPQSAGGPGFSVSVWRKVTVTATAEVVVDETNTWRYKPQNAVVCDG